MNRQRVSMAVIVLVVSVHLPVVAAGQESAQNSRDPRALAILTQAVSLSGASALSAEDYSARGTITYYWAGEEVKGSVMIRGKGTEDFSMDVSLPQSKRLLAISRGNGALQEIDGSTTSVAHYNALNEAASTLPVIRLVAALSRVSTSVYYEGLVDVERQQAHRIRLTTADPVTDPEGRFESLRTLEVFLDAATLLVIKTQDTIHADGDMTDQYLRELIFSDYRVVNGVFVPFSITEKFGGQRTWSLQLDSVSLGTILADSSSTFMAFELF